MSKLQWLLLRLTRRLWLRSTLIGLLGIFAALLATVVDRFLPGELPWQIDAEAVDSLLNVIASSMLAVTTFSLSVTTAALGAATSNVTPRATQLLAEDRVTQNVLSTFLGSFLFGVVGLIVLRTGAYGDRGRVVLFVVTIGVVGLIVITLLRWIEHLTRLGRVGETTARVEAATRAAIEARVAAPCLGGRPLDVDDPLAEALPIGAGTIGYLQHVDMPALSGLAEALEVEIRVLALPGAFVFPGTVLAAIPGARALRESDHAGLRAAFTIGEARSFDQDPRFGLAVMSEIASRALSPAVNDSGTAIDVIGRNARLLAQWAAGAEAEAPLHPRIAVARLAETDLFEDAFMLIARDGAAAIEIQLRLQKVLAALAQQGSPAFRAAAQAQAALARARAMQGLVLDADRARLAQETAGG